jgi:putative cell wall-binding protein
VTTVRRRGLATVLAASILATTIAAAPPALAQTDAPAAASARDDSRTPDAGTGDLSSVAAGLVTGRVQFSTTSNPTPRAVDVGEVVAYRYNPGVDRWFWAAATVEFDAEGDWQIADLPVGTYTFSFRQQTESFNARAWLGGAPSQAFATSVTLTEGTARDLGTVVIPPRDIFTARIAGANRFDTSVRLSSARFSDSADVPVVIVNGLDYPDALSGGPLATALGATMLMVTPTSIPTETQEELLRLDPTLIVIVGGTGVVSGSVATQLTSYVTNPANVVRIAGANRYDTSRRALQFAFDGVLPSQILLATGRNFPDALSAGAAAGFVDGGLLLVDGSAATLDTATRELLIDAGVPVTIVGGTGSISSGIQQTLVSLGLFDVRLSGTDRYSTSALVAAHFFGYADEAFLVNGSGFADALATGPLAASVGGPVYLSTSTCLPLSVWADLNVLAANVVTTVGGRALLSDNVQNLVGCGGIGDLPNTEFR